MTDDETIEPESEAYDLDLEADEDASAEDLIREAVEAVESRGVPLETAAEAAAAVESEAPVEPTPPGDAAGGDELEALRIENKELQERALRALADYENYRRRTEKERADVGRYALFEPMRAFLEVIDNLERAIAAASEESDLKVGVEMTLKQMQELLGRFGVTKVSAEGEEFDPALHEAVARVDDASISAPTVVEEFQTGYVLHERLLRPAMVKVAMPLGGNEEPA
ncbi:MAG: nucleotide exchange factor GrpE [Acidobacteriota bacterium]